MNLKKILVYLGILILVCMLVLLIYMYPFYQFFFTPKVSDLDKDLIMMTGAGNSGILVTDSAVVVIDTKMGSMAKKLHELALEKAGNKKIIVINTHFHGDHLNGNSVFKGCPIYIGGYDSSFARKNIKAENMPTVFIRDSIILDLGNETIALVNLGQGHTYNDLVVYLKNHKTLITGDLVFNKINPALFREDGSDILKWKNLLLELENRWEIFRVIPGHGDAGNKDIITRMVKYFDDMAIAANDPGKSWDVKSQYSDWMKMPMMSSPEKTIKFIKEKN
jgi:cyclase